MTEEIPEKDELEPEEEVGSVRDLLESALDEEPSVPDVLGGVQQRLRDGSGGKFYSDAWSTSRYPPVALYLVTSVLMLLVLTIIFIVLRPFSGEPVPVYNEPAPVRVLPPQ